MSYEPLCPNNKSNIAFKKMKNIDNNTFFLVSIFNFSGNNFEDIKSYDFFCLVWYVLMYHTGNSLVLHWFHYHKFLYTITIVFFFINIASCLRMQFSQNYSVDVENHFDYFFLQNKVGQP